MRSYFPTFLFLIVSFFVNSVQAQDVQLPNPNGQCATGYFPFHGVCISFNAFFEKGADVVFREARKFMEQNHTKIKKTEPTICQSKIDRDKGDILKLENDAIVEISNGYLGYLGYRKDALLFKDGRQWKLWIEGKKIFKVNLLESPSSCRSPSTYQIQAIVNDEIFIINGERFESKTYCYGWSEGEKVIFIDGNEYGSCTSATLFNTNNLKPCDVWCE